VERLVEVGDVLVDPVDRQEYWMRSFVPMLKKATSRASRSATIAAEGISIMMPMDISLS